MNEQASGEFDVKLSPQVTAENEEAGVGRMLIDKHYHGDLDASSKGQMLAHITATKGSAGYVAIEKVTGRLQGKNGSFYLQHNGSKNHLAQQLSISVVPDSAEGELLGLTGTMSITITDGKHFYDFDYDLPET